MFHFLRLAAADAALVEMPSLFPLLAAKKQSDFALHGLFCASAPNKEATPKLKDYVTIDCHFVIVKKRRSSLHRLEMNGQVEYVLEGNINYTGAVMKWIVDDLGLIPSAKDASRIAFMANKADEIDPVPATEELSGVGAAYAAGIALRLFDSKTVFNRICRKIFAPATSGEEKNKRVQGWEKAASPVLTQ